MAYQPQLPKVRGSALRYVDLSTLILNQRDSYNHLVARHTEAGLHNDVRVPRVVALVHWDGSGYALEAATAGVGVTHVGTGVVSVTFPSAVGRGRPYLVRAAVAEAGTWLVNYEALSDTEVEVRLFEWSDGWALADASFTLAVHMEARWVLPDFLGLEEVSVGGLDSPLRSSPTWGGLATNEETLREAMLAEHLADGSHDAVEVAAAVARASWDGAAYVLEDESAAVVSLTRLSAGVVQVDLTGVQATSVWPGVLVAPDGPDGEEWVATAPYSSYAGSGSLDSFEVHLTKRTAADTWAAADGGFRFSIHRSPA